MFRRASLRVYVFFSFLTRSTSRTYLPVYPTLEKHFPLHIPSSSNQRRLVLPIGFCRRSSLEKVEIGFRVGELLAFFDLQASVFVSNNLSDEDHFTVQVYPD